MIQHCDVSFLNAPSTMTNFFLVWKYKLSWMIFQMLGYLWFFFSDFMWSLCHRNFLNVQRNLRLVLHFEENWKRGGFCWFSKFLSVRPHWDILSKLEELGMMSCQGAVDETTTVISTVHDCQVRYIVHNG